MSKWEYLLVDTQNTVQTQFSVMAIAGPNQAALVQQWGNKDIALFLPELGELGWELTFCYPLKAFGLTGQRMLFKRPKS